MANMINTMVNQADIAKRFIDAETFFCAANDKAVEFYHEDSCIKNIAARFLSIMQVIVSIVVVPLAILAMIFLPPIILFTHDKMAARTCMKECAGMAAAHLFRIPESIIGAIFPSILNKPFGVENILPMVMPMMQQLGRGFQGNNPQQMPQGFQGIDPQQFMQGFGGMNLPRGLFDQM